MNISWKWKMDSLIKLKALLTHFLFLYLFIDTKFSACNKTISMKTLQEVFLLKENMEYAKDHKDVVSIPNLFSARFHFFVKSKSQHVP